MSTGPGSRFTIANMMVVVAGTALALGVALTPGLGRALGGFLILSTVLIVSSLLGARRVGDLVSGYRCPNCHKRGLERRAVVSFGERFFLCPSCGIRCKRTLVGGYGMFQWGDASGPEYDAYYRKGPGEDPWNAPPGLEDEDIAYSKTHVNLVNNKRRRHPENPNGPGLE